MKKDNELNGRYRQLARVLRLLRRIEREEQCPRLEVLAGQLQVSTRTVRRDLEALRAVGEHVPPMPPPPSPFGRRE